VSERTAEAERQIRLATAVERLVERQDRTNQDLTRIAGAVDGALIHKLPTEMASLREQILNAFAQHQQAELQAIHTVAARIESRLDKLAESVAKLEAANTWSAEETSKVRERIVTGSFAALPPDKTNKSDKHIGLIDRLDRVQTRTWIAATLFLLALVLSLGALLVIRGKYAPNVQIPVLDKNAPAVLESPKH
jgi:hypothetical protein